MVGLLALDGSGDPDVSRALFGAWMAHYRIQIECDVTIAGTIGKHR
jgi:hypothetical protein